MEGVKTQDSFVQARGLEQQDCIMSLSKNRVIL